MPANRFEVNCQTGLYLPLWMLDGASLADRSAYGRLCTAGGPTLYPGRGRHFDGIDDNMTVSITALGTGDYSIFIWFKSESASMYLTAPTTNITGIYAFPHIRPHYSANVIWNQRVAAGSATIPWTANNNWNNVAWTRASGVLAGYINGDSQVVTLGDYGSQDGIDFTDTSYFISSFLYSGTNYYTKGTVGEQVIYNRALNANEIQSLYLATKGRYR